MRIGGMQFGTFHRDATIDGWSLCTGGSEIPGDGWPAPSTGNAVTWADGCVDPGGATTPVG